MCKKSFVTLNVGRKNFKIDIDDISAVHTSIKRKRPRLPSF